MLRGRPVAQTMIILTIAVAGIVTIVHHSIALGFSLAGIVAGVRFRSSVAVLAPEAKPGWSLNAATTGPLARTLADAPGPDDSRERRERAALRNGLFPW
jgi:hypothetical protein